MDASQKVIELSKKMNGDAEHDQYLLFALMKELRVDEDDQFSYSHLYKTLCEEIDIMIGDLSEEDESFNKEDSNLISSIENILDVIEDVYH